MIILKLALRKLFRKGEYTSARMISLGTGLAFGLILLGEVLYYYSFDNCYPDLDNIYIVAENYKQDKQKEQLKSRNYVSGAIALGLQAEVPGIEAATRLNHFATTDFFTSDNKKYHGSFSFADKHWQDVLPRPMIRGNARKILTTPMQCMISDELAAKMGGNVIGKSIHLQSRPDAPLIIEGVFKRLPENTNYKYDILVSMISTKKFIWDGTENWLGNDRYYTCVKLKKGITPKSLAPAVRKMQEKYQGIEEIERKNPGFVLKYSFTKIKTIMADKYKSMIFVLSIIAFSVLFVALMNYILLTVSTLVNRAKFSAIHKCYGAKENNIQAMIFTEAIMVFVMSLALAGLIIYIAKPFIEQQVAHQISSMLSWGVILPLVGLLIIVILVIGYIPGRFFAKIPVAVAFRNYKQKGNKWKLGLLSLQFFGASFIFTTLVIVSMQYNKMQNADHGYQTSNVYYLSTKGLEKNKLTAVFNEFEKMPDVELVGLGETLPIFRTSGNNVRSIDGEKELFNVADFYYIDENYMKILGIPIEKGTNFTVKNNTQGDILISRLGANKLIAYNKWANGVIGKSISITEHHNNGNEKARVTGIFTDFIIGSITNTDTRPSVFFFMPQSKYIQFLQEHLGYNVNILIRVTQQHSSDIMQKIADVVNIASPTKDVRVFSLEEQKRRVYHAEKGFRNVMFIGNIIILLITLIGLLGFALSEVNRRRKELAIRKINGATICNVFRLFLWNMERVAIPAIIIGVGLARFVVGKWMQNFSQQITLHWYLFLACGLIILLFIGIITIASYWRTANKNPVEALRYE